MYPMMPDLKSRALFQFRCVLLDIIAVPTLTKLLVSKSFIISLMTRLTRAKS